MSYQSFRKMVKHRIVPVAQVRPVGFSAERMSAAYSKPQRVKTKAVHSAASVPFLLASVFHLLHGFRGQEEMHAAHTVSIGWPRAHCCSKGEMDSVGSKGADRPYLHKSCRFS